MSIFGAAMSSSPTSSPGDASACNIRQFAFERGQKTVERYLEKGKQYRTPRATREQIHAMQVNDRKYDLAHRVIMAGYEERAATS